MDNKRYYGYNKRIKDYGILCCDGYLWDSVCKKNILTFRSFANPTLCSSVTNNTFSIERSPNGVAFARFVRISLFRQMVWIKSCFLNVAMSHFFLTIHEPVAKFSCSNKENYVIGECKKCSSKKCSSHNWHTRSTSVSDVDGENENVSKDSMSHYKWNHCKDNKLQNVLFKTSIDKGTKTNNNGKSRVLILATLRSVYSPIFAVSMMLRIKWSVIP